MISITETEILNKYIKSETIQQILWKKWKNYIVHKYDIT